MSRPAVELFDIKSEALSFGIEVIISYLSGRAAQTLECDG